MGLQTPAAEGAGDLSQDFAGTLRYVARQPILDLRGRVHGYELLFRSGPETAFRGDGDLATRTMFDNTVMFGLERLTGSLPAFVNCTEEALTGSLVHILPPGMTVLEILEDLEPTPRLIAACRSLKAAGFRLALDDFEWKPEFEPLIALADYIKVDFVKLSVAGRHELLKKTRGTSICMIAEKVETHEEYKQACKEGFKLFQGYYFCKPVLMKNRKIPANRMPQIEILEVLQRDPLDLKRLSRLVMRDASLTHRLLRLVNSPAFAMHQEVSSIESAMLAVGDDTFRRMATLAIASELNAGRPAEILRMAFIRGRFCELAAAGCELDAEEQYLAGVLSMFPAMLRIPMDEMVKSLPLRKEMRMALLGQSNREGTLLRWVECLERGAWAACDEIASAGCLNAETGMRQYSDAVEWAEDALKTTA
jgi:c-di-GMP-related signal transduction protein